MSGRRPVDQRLFEIGRLLRHSPDRHAYFSEAFTDDIIEDLAALLQCGDDAALLKLVKSALENPAMRLAIARANACEERQLIADALAGLDPLRVAHSTNTDRETGIPCRGEI